MEKLEALIKSLKEAKEELSKATKSEPHKDDPKHEKKEQEKAKVIKDKAEEILDMHKGEECLKMSANGQWSLEKAGHPFSSKNIDKPLTTSERKSIEERKSKVLSEKSTKPTAPRKAGSAPAKQTKGYDSAVKIGKPEQTVMGEYGKTPSTIEPTEEDEK